MKWPVVCGAPQKNFLQPNIALQPDTTILTKENLFAIQLIIHVN